MRKFLTWALLIIGFSVAAVAAAVPVVQKTKGDVAFCLTCHVMDDAGQTHASSTHREVATCSDCHTGSIMQKYTDGVRHIIANTTGVYPDPITIRDASKAVVTGQCFECHAELSLHARQKQEKNESCLECHTGHEKRSIDLPDLVHKKQGKDPGK